MKRITSGLEPAVAQTTVREIAVNVPANKLPVNIFILILSAMTPTGKTEEFNRYLFRVARK